MLFSFYSPFLSCCLIFTFCFGFNRNQKIKSSAGKVYFYQKANNTQVATLPLKEPFKNTQFLNARK